MSYLQWDRINGLVHETQSQLQLILEPPTAYTAYMADAELRKLMKMLDWKPRMKKSKAEREAAERAARPAAAAGKPAAGKPARAAARKKK